MQVRSIDDSALASDIAFLSPEEDASHLRTTTSVTSKLAAQPEPACDADASSDDESSPDEEPPPLPATFVPAAP